MLEIDEVKKYNYRNAVHLLREKCKGNKVGEMSRSEYRFLMYEGLISRNVCRNSGRIYVLTGRGKKELMGYEL